MKNQKKNINANRLGLYFSLFLCVLALGVGALSAKDRSEKLGSQNAVTTKSVVEIRKNQTDVQKDTTTSASPTSSTLQTTRAQKTTKRIVAAKFCMPIDSEIIKEYSSDRLIYSDTFCDWRRHDGIDIKADVGEKVLCAGDGRVKKVYTDESLGKVVAINHGNKTLTYYCGLDDVQVQKGDVVTLGQTIGTLGEIPSESADEPHLHFFVEKDSKTVDPLKTLGINDTKKS